MSRMAVFEVAPRARLPRLLAAVRVDGSPVPLDEHLAVYGAPPGGVGAARTQVTRAAK